MTQPMEEAVGMKALWRQFLPLSLSDVTMACGDPMVTTTMAHLPDAKMNIGAVGLAKALAVFFESPIIMMLHASNVMAAAQASRRALWRFMLLAGGAMSVMLLVLALPPVFAWFGTHVLRVDGELLQVSRSALLFLVLWPMAIAWRRYFQGILIRAGFSKVIGHASFARLGAVALVLAIGFMGQVSGAHLAGMALILGVLVEAAVVTWAARPVMKREGVVAADSVAGDLPTRLPEIWRFYWPLANAMVIVWGGRALLVAMMAWSSDAAIALAAWPAAWGLVLVVANATRMVQQVIIKNRRRVSDGLLWRFAGSVGGLCSLLLFVIAVTPVGHSIITAFIGDDQSLARGMQPVIFICAAVPLLVALQNAAQGMLMSDGKTKAINVASMLGTVALLLLAWSGVEWGLHGATAAAIAMLVALLVELSWLAAAAGVFRSRSLAAATASLSQTEGRL